MDWELEHKESWVPKNWCFWIVVLDKTLGLQDPLDCKAIKSVNPKGNQPWILIGRTDAEVEAPILWSPDGKNWLVGKEPDAGKDWRQEEKGTAEDEMVDGITESMGTSLTSTDRGCRTRKFGGCCSPWRCKALDTTEKLNNNKDPR